MTPLTRHFAVTFIPFLLAIFAFAAWLATLATGQDELQPAPRVLTITLTYPHQSYLDAPGTKTWKLLDTDGQADWGVFAGQYVASQTTDPYFKKYRDRAVKSLKDLGQIEAVDRIELGDGAFVRCSVEAAGGEL